MTDKKKIILIALAVLIVIGIVFSFARDGGVAPEQELNGEAENAVAITGDAHFFRAGTDGEPGIRNSGEAIEVFNQGDLFGLAGRYEVAVDSRVETRLLDENDEVIQENLFRSTRAGSSGTFEICCREVPEEPGSYKVEAESNGTILGIFLFEVGR